jgi:hypothetical protein
LGVTGPKTLGSSDEYNIHFFAMKEWVLEEERTLSAKNTDAEQTNLTQSRRDLAGR